MYPFANAVTPAVRSHLDAQVAYFNDLSKSLTRSFQNLVEANIQLSQTLVEESTIASHKLLTTEGPTDAIGITAARAQPAAEKLRAYQQHISRVAADAQVELSRVAEQHVQSTSRTARELAEQVNRVASEELDNNRRRQEESLKNFRDPFQDAGRRSGNEGGNGRFEAHGSLQSGSAQFDSEAGSASFHGSVQGQAAQPQAAGKASKAN